MTLFNPDATRCPAWVWPAALLGAMIGIQTRVGLSPWLWAMAMIGCLTMTLVALRCRWDMPWLLPVLALTAGGQAGSHQEEWRMATRIAPTEHRVPAQIDDIRMEGHRYRIRLRLWDRPNALAVIHRTDLPPEIQPGASVLLNGPFSVLGPAMNPGGYDARLHGEVHGEAWRYRGPLILMEPASMWSALGFKLHRWARRHLKRLGNETGSGLLQGLLLGDRQSVPRFALDSFEQTGTGHLLAVSGLHIAGTTWVVFYFVMWILSILRFVEPVRLAMIAALPVGVLMVLMAQSPLSAVRSATMLSLYLGTRLLGRSSRMLDIWSAVGLLLLMDQPVLMETAGFQLSFAAVGALIGLTGKEGGLVGTMWTCLVASCATAPIIAWHFGLWVPSSPLCNAIIVPPASLVLVPLGLMGLAWAPLTLLPLEGAAELAVALASLTEALAEFVGPASVVGQQAAAVLTIPLILLGASRFSKARYWAALATATIIYLAQTSPRDSVEFIYVGQGDAILIRSGHEAALVDAGPDPNARIIKSHLRRLGINRLRWVLITHGHPDHFAGLKALCESVRVDLIRFNGRRLPRKAWGRFMKTAASKGIRFAAEGNRTWTMGNLRIQSFEPLSGEHISQNNASLPTLITGISGRILLTGDMETAAEKHLLERYTGGADVMQVPHHGSSTSSHAGLIKAVRPEHAIVSVGRGNRHGLPKKAIELRYEELGTKVWRTDVHGLIRIELDAPLKVTSHHRPQTGLRTH